VLELLRDIFGIRTKDSVEISRRRVLDRFAPIASSDQQLLLLLEFLGLADPERPAPKLDPRARTIQLLDLVRTLARSGPGDAATVVLIEDLHWIDAASEEFVDALADAIVGTTTLLVVNFRPGFVASFMQRSHYRHIVIPPLASEEAHRPAARTFRRGPVVGLAQPEYDRACARQPVLPGGARQRDGRTAAISRAREVLIG
jgi:adenylate cyclase